MEIKSGNITDKEGKEDKTKENSKGSKKVR